jgi:hemoglobin
VSEAQGPSLYERLGGEAAVEAAVVLLHDRLAKAPELLRFFEGFELHDQLQVHIRFVMAAFGRPDEGRPYDLRRAHARLIPKGLGAGHFDAVVGAMADVLDELGVIGADREHVLAHIRGTRSEVLGS